MEMARRTFMHVHYMYMYRAIRAYLFVERACDGRLGDSAWWIKYPGTYKAVISESSF